MRPLHREDVVVVGKAAVARGDARGSGDDEDGGEKDD
jgi:hypothetical protein